MVKGDRAFLAAQGMKEGDLSKFVEEAVRWRVFHETVNAVRKGFADVPDDELQRNIDEAVEAVREKHYQERSSRS